MHEKQTLRHELMAARKIRHERDSHVAAQSLVAHIDALALPANQMIAAYLPMGSEINVQPLMVALAAGHELCLPVCETHDAPMVFRRFCFGDALTTDIAGIAAPLAEARPCRPDIIFLPLLGFDLHANRLGRGAGYYDRTIAALRQSGDLRCYGVAYDMQMVDKCPTEPHDQALDGVVTEAALYLF